MLTPATAAPANTHVRASLPAVTAWIVENKKSGKLATCTARHTRRGRRLRASEVSSTATRR